MEEYQLLVIWVTLKMISVIYFDKDPNWYKGKNESGKEGMVPATYVQKRKEVHLQAMP